MESSSSSSSPNTFDESGINSSSSSYTSPEALSLDHHAKQEEQGKVAEQFEPPHPKQRYPETWGHRGSSGQFPENTMKAFEAAIAQGATCIETDVHLTKDNVIIMSHDPSLDRVTNGHGLIKDHDYFDDIDRLVTKKEPHQKIPTLKETIALLAQPENSHIKLNLDIKMRNPPEILFQGIHQILSKYPDHETLFSSNRIILGLWHPKFIEPAKRILPYLGLAHIGVSVYFARQYFWDQCSAFSMEFHSMVGLGGATFRDDCARAGKKVMVWTVNERASMIQAIKWGNCDAVLTDYPVQFTKLREELEGDNRQSVWDEVTWRFAWSRWKFFTVSRIYFDRLARHYLIKIGGPLDTPTSSEKAPDSQESGSREGEMASASS